MLLWEVLGVINASAPVRICDIGGWTDTWFGGPGRVVNIAMAPGVEVSIRETTGPHRVMLDAVNFADRYPIVPGASRVARHPLLEAAVDACPPPENLAVEIGIRSAVPAGCGTGTSAAVAVALLGALATLHSEQVSPRDVAYAAHRLEVDVLGQESGIQDQFSAAFGGINYLVIDSYPEAAVSALPMWNELEARLTVVFLGRAHDSSGLHRHVIESVGHGGSQVFARLRDAAEAAHDAVLAQDLHALGQAMIVNTEAQRSLHRELVGPDASRVIEMCAAHGAIGWKVNGAGGDGGSVTILSEAPETRGALERHVADLDNRWQVLPVQLSKVGLEVRVSPHQP